ncbi:hypothetical protein EB796_000943 [Bugula neritina]|uniref:Uncharacterized protein n=1 Tax=Bugula neritina TaxID=10212 RepID=A0A7J7KRB7_BUGNE|nr:hypothetical protein EB796_000943 [Bugula neritina]
MLYNFSCSCPLCDLHVSANLLHLSLSSKHSEIHFKLFLIFFGNSPVPSCFWFYSVASLIFLLVWLGATSQPEFDRTASFHR